MKHEALAGIITSGLVAASASAESKDLLGKWAIETSIGSPCTFKGEATLSPPKPNTTDSEYNCELTMHWVCQPPEPEYHVRQSCRVRNIRGQITVQSEIIEIKSGQQGGYRADNFRLSVQSPNELDGSLLSNNVLRSTWTRLANGIS